MLSGVQCRMARALLGWSVQELADNAKVGTTTIKRIELIDAVSDGAQVGTLKAVSKAFTDTGKVHFEGLNGVFALNV